MQSNALSLTSKTHCGICLCNRFNPLNEGDSQIDDKDFLRIEKTMNLNGVIDQECRDQATTGSDRII